MKRFFCFILCAVAILGTPFGMDAQNRKAQRQARREQKSREREVADSMMKVLFGDRSRQRRIRIGKEEESYYGSRASCGVVLITTKSR